MSDKLKPCPFCGGKPSTSMYYIECLNSKCEVQPNIDWFHFPKDRAIKAWNTRAELTKEK